MALTPVFEDGVDISLLKTSLAIDDKAECKTSVELPAGKCRVIDIDALIQAKEAMGRDHDKVTVKQLKAIKKWMQAESVCVHAPQRGAIIGRILFPPFWRCIGCFATMVRDQR